MKAKAYVVHRLPGRIRFKVPARRADRSFLGELERRLRRLPSVIDVKTNPVTGSVLVAHKGEAADLAKEAFGSDVGELVDIVLSAPPVARRLRSDITSMDQAVRQFTDGEVDLATLTSLSLLAFAAVQLVRGQPPVHVVHLGWYATELLRRSADGAEQSAG